ncbi:2898_t:CDS:10 [Ambispora leptoticha]|uniref:2898_t:CDS:1 n=1 Tax=Ambispora leptoticha TaxID=144679 RepID=A0A9N9EXW3_9GLOM|nr:2898_t:CDS:10 [Ambispora leptoticha]
MKAQVPVLCQVSKKSKKSIHVYPTKAQSPPIAFASLTLPGNLNISWDPDFKTPAASVNASGILRISFWKVDPKISVETTSKIFDIQRFDMAELRKRKPIHKDFSSRKKQKGFYKRFSSNTAPVGLKPGISGIFVSCPKDKEPLCIQECYNLFNEYAEKLYDIEDSIARELAQIKKKHGDYLFSSIQTGSDCIVFIKTKPPVEPANFVHQTLSDIYDNKLKKSRFIQRLTPITKTCYANMPAIIELAKEVIGPHFHSQDEITEEEKKNIRYSIVPRIRNNHKIDRTQLIGTLAEIVGKQHTVNLDNPELAVIVEVFKSICGISVVRDYIKFKKFNLELISNNGDNLNTECIQTKMSSTVEGSSTNNYDKVYDGDRMDAMNDFAEQFSSLDLNQSTNYSK